MHIFYRNNSTPLKKIDLYNLNDGDLFINSSGTRYEYLGEGAFINNKRSELMEDNTVEELDNHHLNLFWTLMKNKTWK